jgi:hypothetical protein
MALFAHELGSRPDTVMKLSFGPELEPRCSETTASCTNDDFTRRKRVRSGADCDSSGMLICSERSAQYIYANGSTDSIPSTHRPSALAKILHRRHAAAGHCHKKSARLKERALKEPFRRGRKGTGATHLSSKPLTGIALC